MTAPAPGAAEALHAAGTAVNSLDLTSESAIRRAIPIAASAAARSKGQIKGTGQYGRNTGLRIAKAQNWLYEQNRSWHFTDGTLCVLWCVEFPDAKSDYAARSHYISSTRTAYNAGRHQAPAPTVPCVGNGGRKVAGRAPGPAPQPAPTPKAQPSPLPAKLASPVLVPRHARRDNARTLCFTSDPKATSSRRRALEAIFRQVSLPLVVSSVDTTATAGPRMPVSSTRVSSTTWAPTSIWKKTVTLCASW